MIFHSYFGGDTAGWGHPRVETQYYRNFRIFTVPDVDNGASSDPSDGDQSALLPEIRIDDCHPPGDMRDFAFTDVSASSPHMRAIACIAEWNVTRGVAAGAYRPAHTVTRAQMATFLARVIAASDAP